MRVIQNRQYSVLFFFTFLIALNSACSNQVKTNQDAQTQVSDNLQVSESKSDTSLQLKFQSGIRSILEDRNGNVWFGSHQGGVCLFDGKKLTYFTTEDGLSNNQVRSIFEHSNGTVWFEGGEGISFYDGKKIVTQTEKNHNFKNDWQANKNDLWFKGDESTGFDRLEGTSGVYRYDGNTFNYLVFPLIPKTTANNNSYSISTPFFKGKNGRVWFGTYAAVFGYDGTNFIIIDDESLGLNEETGYLHVRSIHEDSKGNLWIGNNGIGVLMYDGDTTINFSGSQGLISANSLLRGGYRSPAESLEHVFSIGEDLDGNMWFGDRDTGAWRYDGKTMKNYTKKDGLTSTHIWQIYNSKNGELWFAMGDGNVLKFNGKSFDRIF